MLVNALAAPNTVVWLSSIQYPGHIVGIRDTTGSSEITSRPIVVSTTQGIKFYDGTFSTLINQPLGSVVVSSKDPQTWQLLNTAGFFTSLSNAYLNTLTSEFSYINQVSTIEETVSTSVIQYIDITNTIFLGGNTQIIGDIVVNGPVKFLSSMTVDKVLSLSSFFSVQGDFVTTSSLAIQGDTIFGRYVSTPNNLVASVLSVEKELAIRGLLLPYNLSVQTLYMNLGDIGGGIQLANNLSTLSNSFIGQDLTVQGSTLITSSVTVLGSTAIGGRLDVASNVTTKNVSTIGFVNITQDVSLEGSLTVSSSASTLGNIAVAQLTNPQGLAVFRDNVFVTGLTEFKSLNLQGSANISSFHAYSTVSIRDNALSYGTLFRVTNQLELLSSLAVGGSVLANQSYGSFNGVSTLKTLGVGKDLLIGGSLDTKGNLVSLQSITNVSTLDVQGTASTLLLNVYGDLNVLSNLYVGQILGASTLGAPIDLSISTLSLSNTLFVSAEGKVPLLDIDSYPAKILAGGALGSAYDVGVEGVLQNRSTVNQTTIPDYTKLWYASEGRASTIQADVLVSSFFIGPIGTKPLISYYGGILTGQFTGASNLFYSSNISTNYKVASNGFVGSQGGNKVVWNGSNQWVSVGDPGLFGASNSVLTSRDGYSWVTANTGGFVQGAYSVAYGNGLWVSVGYTGGAAATIQTSTDGVTWSGATNPFPAATGGGNDVAYNGSNLWVSAGSNTPGTFGMKYSVNGTVWINGNLTPPIPFQGLGVGYGGGRWVASGTNQMITSTDGINWTLIPSFTLTKTTFAYNGTLWMAGGPATGANPLTSIHFSPNGLVWIPIVSGGFTDKCTDIQWDPVNNLWLATGGTNPNTTLVLQYSFNGSNWIGSDGTNSLGIARGIGVGMIRAPDTDNYFMPNVTSIVRQTLSSVSLTASTVQISSIQSGSFFGEGSGLSNLNKFRSTIYASSLIGQRAYALDISAMILQSEYATINNSLTVTRNPFLSTIDLWLAAGYDSQTNGNIQTSFTGQQWTRGIGPTFNYFAKSIQGNSNVSSPLYVATGADSRTPYTIQWSLNGKTWNPSLRGGFDTAVDGVKQGNSVAYNKALDTWVIAGFNPGTTSTLFYSADAKNWFCAMNGFTDVANYVAASPSGFVALGSNSIKYSLNGTTWSDSATSLTLNTAAYGLISTGFLLGNYWLGFSNTSLYLSGDNGAIWQATTSNSLFPVTSAVYGGSNWIGVGQNKIQYSQSGLSWSNVITDFAPDVNFNTVAYNSNQAKWVAGAVSTTADKSLWSSSNILNWASAQSGGFSTSIVQSGAGYGIFTSSTYTFAAGQASFTGVTETKQAILEVLSYGAGNIITSNSLTLSNTQNVFQSVVRGIAGSAEETFHYVAVGDGEVPQKTIARSLNAAANSWIPAITGGFSTVGYGVTHFNDIWLAVGDAQATSNTIQYSTDSANWFGTNNALALRQGGRGIGVGIGALSNTVIAVGKDAERSTIAYTSTGYTWTGGIGSFFTVQGNAVAGGSNGSAPNFVAVGQDSRGFRSTILRSTDGLSWSNTLSGGFTGGGFGVAYGPGKGYVAVGLDTNSNRTIQFSSDGGANFSQVTSGAFTRAGYGVSYNMLSNSFIAVGEDAAALRNATIKTSSDGLVWQNISTGSGFLSQTTLGAAYSVYTQQILNGQITPYIEFSNLILYEGEDPLLYPQPTLRVQSSFMIFNEALSMNLSSQVVINSNSPYSTNTVLTVNGSIYASSFLYTGDYVYSDTLIVSSLVVSTLSSVTNLNSIYFTTPNLAFNTSESKPNYISTYQDTFYNYEYNDNILTNMINLNGVVYTTANVPTRQKTGICISSPLYDLDIKTSLGTSSFSTLFAFAPAFVQTQQTNGSVIQDPYFSMLSAKESSIPLTSNSIVSAQSTLILNSIVSMNQSTQKVGLFTTNPQFTLDVRRQTYIQTVSTPLLNTSLLFLTLQSA